MAKKRGPKIRWICPVTNVSYRSETSARKEEHCGISLRCRACPGPVKYRREDK